ncbi:alpha/beta-Hydrolases superfamily protein, partial [Prunus dulcis]
TFPIERAKNPSALVWSDVQTNGWRRRRRSVSPTAGGFRLRWDVFLSFRGEDTRSTITKNIYEELEKRSVRVFRDDEGLNRGDEIASSLLEAIEDSAAAIVVLSPRYAESRWCLEELAKICERSRRLRLMILPVFYQVDPSDVRRQRAHLQSILELMS